MFARTSAAREICRTYQVDLGRLYASTRSLSASAKTLLHEYNLLVSDDGVDWKTVAHVGNNDRTAHIRARFQPERRNSFACKASNRTARISRRPDVDHGARGVRVQENRIEGRGLKDSAFVEKQNGSLCPSPPFVPRPFQRPSISLSWHRGNESAQRGVDRLRVGKDLRYVRIEHNHRAVFSGRPANRLAAPYDIEVVFGFSSSRRLAGLERCVFFIVRSFLLRCRRAVSRQISIW